MDSVSHTRVGKILLAYIEQNRGVSFDSSAFLYGNLKPDLTGTYLTKRHNPSIMYDEVMDMIRDFAKNYTISDENNDRDLCVDLGVICHYITDFFTYPHNDDLYHKSLLAHYIYEKHTSFTISKRIDPVKFDRFVGPVIATHSVEGLISRIGELHERYKNEKHHNISNDMIYTCQVVTMVTQSIINITYEEKSQANDNVVSALA